jgi:hypothetical protein
MKNIINAVVITPCYLSLCHHSMVCPQVVDGGDGLKIWRVAVNILSKQSQTADKG